MQCRWYSTTNGSIVAHVLYARAVAVYKGSFVHDGGLIIAWATTQRIRAVLASETARLGGTTLEDVDNTGMVHHADKVGTPVEALITDRRDSKKPRAATESREALPGESDKSVSYHF